jgi:hypothetical protein
LPVADPDFVAKASALARIDPGCAREN